MRATWVGLLALLMLAAGLRFYGLDLQSLWNDEGTSVALAQRSLATIAEQASQDIHPPLYYFLLHGWIKLVGTSEAAVRSLSALLGVLTVALTWLLTRDTLVGAEQASVVPWLAGLLVAVSPFHVWYAQEARMYMLVTFAGLASMWALVQLWRAASADNVKPIHWVAYALASIVAIYSHYFAFALILAQNLAWLVRAISACADERPWWPALWRRAWRWALMQLVILMAYLPWLVVSFGSLTRWPAVASPLSLPALLARVVRVFWLGLYYPPGNATICAAAAVALLAGLGLLWRWRDRSGRWLLVLYATVPVALMYVLSLSRPMYKPKFLLLATPAYHILQAAGIALLTDLASKVLRGRGRALWSCIGPWLLCAAVCAFPAMALHDLYTNDVHYRDDYRGIVAYIEATASPDDAILINAPSQIETVDYYYHGSLPEYPLPTDRPLDWSSTQADLERIVAQHRRVYAIYWATDESDPQGLIEGWMGANCYQAMDRWFGDLRLVVYATPQAPATEIEHELDIALGDAILLQGYSMLTPKPESGDILQVTLHWEALAPVEQRFKVFVHLLDPQSNIAAQRDTEPAGGTRPTDTWAVGEAIGDNYGLLVPAGTPPGKYTLRVGMYDPQTGVRLPVGADGATDHVDAGMVLVSPPASPLPDAAIQVQVRHGDAWPGIELVGHSLFWLGHEHESELNLRSGDAMRLELVWRAQADGLAAETWHLSLLDRRGAAALTQALTLGGGSYPPSAWAPGELVRDVTQMHLPADLAAGQYALSLAPASGEGVVLQSVRIAEP